MQSDLRKYMSCYSFGFIAESYFHRNGKREGERKIWHENGQLCEQGFYINGKREGKYKCWYKDGRICGKLFYRNGKLDGQCINWNKDGTLISKGFYRDSEPINLWSAIRIFIQLKRRAKNHINLLTSLIIVDLAKIVCL